MIKTFSSKETEKLFSRQRSAALPGDLYKAALRKLLLLDAAENIEDLRQPPGIRLEKSHGDRSGQYSIRINDKWRICFRWSGSEALEVEIGDYH